MTLVFRLIIVSSIVLLPFCGTSQVDSLITSLAQQLEGKWIVEQVEYPKVFKSRDSLSNFQGSVIIITNDSVSWFNPVNKDSITGAFTIYNYKFSWSEESDDSDPFCDDNDDDDCNDCLWIRYTTTLQKLRIKVNNYSPKLAKYVRWRDVSISGDQLTFNTNLEKKLYRFVFNRLE